MPGDRDQPRGKRCGDDGGALRDAGSAGGERHAGGRRAHPGCGRRQRGGGLTGAGLSYAVSGAGATINAATGVVRLPTATLVSSKLNNAYVDSTAANLQGSRHRDVVVDNTS